MIPGPEGPWRMTLAKELTPCLEKSRSVCARCFFTMFGLKRQYACESFRTRWFEEIPSLSAACSIGQTKSDIMIAIRPGCPERRRVMTFLIELKIDTEKC
jgi:hypothetical protein